MPLLLIGLNHKSAPISVREKLANLCEVKLPDVDGFNLESVPVYTCNRVEVYYFGAIKAARKSFTELLSSEGLDYKEFSDFFYEYKAEEAIKHLFEVSSGLDSMILGENQILHQVKVSYLHSTEMGYVGKQLHSLFQKALEVGKKVRTETKISENQVSIASTAVTLAKSIFGNLESTNTLIIGAGEMASLVALHLKDNKVGKMIFTNRTIEKAEELALKFDGSYEEFENLDKLLPKADIIISSTGAPYHIINYNQMKKATTSKRGMPVFAIDIAVPRDIEEKCHDIPNLYLYNVDDLQKVVDESFDLRKIEAEKVRTIVNYEASQFQISLKSFTVVPIIKKIRQQAEAIREKELESLFSSNSQITPELKESLCKFSKQLMAKWLHKTTTGLKRQGSTDEVQLKLVCDIFGVELSSQEEKPLHLLSKAKQESK